MPALSAQNFLQEPSDKNAVLFTSFSLNPNEEWGHIVNLLKWLTLALTCTNNSERITALVELFDYLSAEKKGLAHKVIQLTREENMPLISTTKKSTPNTLSGFLMIVVLILGNFLAWLNLKEMWLKLVISWIR